MIQSGRKANKPTTPNENKHYVSLGESRRTAGLTAILGTLVFTLFLCLSTGENTEAKDVGNSFGEGAYQVFAPTDEVETVTEFSDTEGQKEAIAVEDGSVWSYLESVIFRLIYGDR